MRLIATSFSKPSARDDAAFEDLGHAAHGDQLEELVLAELHAGRLTRVNRNEPRVYGGCRAKWSAAAGGRGRCRSRPGAKRALRADAIRSLRLRAPPSRARRPGAAAARAPRPRDSLRRCRARTHPRRWSRRMGPPISSGTTVAPSSTSSPPVAASRYSSARFSARSSRMRAGPSSGIGHERVGVVAAWACAVRCQQGRTCVPSVVSACRLVPRLAVIPASSRRQKLGKETQEEANHGPAISHGLSPV